MVVYHSLNYTSEYHLAFRYLSFLPSSFIFITGFLLARVYAVHYDVKQFALYQRLWIRGAKLLGLFTALNVTAHFIQGRNPVGQTVGISHFLDSWIDVYLNGGSRLAAFEVLLPIAYLLFLAPLLLWVDAQHRVALGAVTVGLLVYCVWADFQGEAYANLNFIGVGVLGMLVGRLAPENLGTLGRLRWALLAAYLVYFYFAMSLGYVYLMQVVGATVALALIYAFCPDEGDGFSRARLIRLGQYSLVAYIAQIGILQILSRFVGRPPPVSAGSALLLFGTLIIMTAGIELTQWLRTRSAGVERLYKAVFA